MVGNDLAQPWLAVLGAVDERLICGLDERCQLFDGRLAELWRGLGDEVGPELSGVLLAFAFCRFGEVDEFLDEAERLELARPRALGGEHDGVATIAQDGGQPDALVRRPVCGLRPEHDRQGFRHRRTFLRARTGGPMWTILRVVEQQANPMGLEGCGRARGLVKIRRGPTETRPCRTPWRRRCAR